jgi:hypothetical protein
MQLPMAACSAYPLRALCDAGIAADTTSICLVLSACGYGQAQGFPHVLGQRRRGRECPPGPAPPSAIWCPRVPSASMAPSKRPWWRHSSRAEQQFGIAGKSFFRLLMDGYALRRLDRALLNGVGGNGRFRSIERVDRFLDAVLPAAGRRPNSFAIMPVDGSWSARS